MISVISFNIFCADGENGHSLYERAPRILAVLEEQKADLIGF